MNQNNLQYFSDLKFFFKHIRNYYILFLLFFIISLILGYLKYNFDTENIEIKSVNKIVLEKKIFKSYEFYLENYELKSQVYPFSKIYDLYDMTFEMINENILIFRNKKKSNFSLNKYNNNTKIVYEFKNIDVNLDDINRITDNVKNEIKDKINDYKKIEISKNKIKLNKFLYDIATNGNYLDSFLYDEITVYNNFSKEITNLETNEKIGLIEKTLDGSMNYQLNNLPESLFKELLIDNEYRKIFEISVKNHFYQLCQTSDYENDVYCKYNKFEQYDFKLKPNILKCEVASDNYDYKIVISSILKNKIDCSNGYKMSEKTIFLPLEDFLKQIKFSDLLFDIYLEEEKIDLNKPIIIIYLLYSLILSFFISIIISFFHSLYKHKK